MSRNSCESVEWYTPETILEKVRKVFDDDIDLDPASCQTANLVVRANRFYSCETDGLSQDWKAKNVFLNPPGGKTGNTSNSFIWWNKFLSEYKKGNFQSGIYLGFSVEQLCINDTMLDWFICFCRKRIKFVQSDLKRNAPTHSNFLLLVSEDPSTIRRFVKEFEDMGKVILGIDP